MSSHPEPVHFNVFDRDAEVEPSDRYLPHWFQPGVAVFVTFRTADSLPRAVVARWQDEQRLWLGDMESKRHRRGRCRTSRNFPGTFAGSSANIVTAVGIGIWIVAMANACCGDGS